MVSFDDGTSGYCSVGAVNARGTKERSQTRLDDGGYIFRAGRRVVPTQADRGSLFVRMRRVWAQEGAEFVIEFVDGEARSG